MVMNDGSKPQLKSKQITLTDKHTAVQIPFKFLRSSKPLLNRQRDRLVCLKLSRVPVPSPRQRSQYYHYTANLFLKIAEA